ncbi:DNA primase [Azospirillum sp. TSO22-1]|uniref:DNA primase n=1 Tax=Azospirillum sp. TSO22-1 TaxID=716789 RepID=UPI000D618910|nr:DNA primase [Azospirillum sp. TSO22-1]PWC35474.1 DNA primase [Azospirillum sp. TSO22-1]
MAFPPQFLEELRTRLALSDVVSKRMRLQRAGREYKAPCPFHNEKTPSFYVNDQKGFFHCFGCGAHGDIIGFVMRHDNLAFPEAVEALASEAGLPVPRPTEEDRHRYERQKTLHDLTEQACRWFERQLVAPAGRAGYDYFRRRGLDDEIIARFRLGFAPADGNALRQYMLSQGFGDDDMVTAGLLKRPEDGRAPFSFFRNRVIFPVADRRGRIVAFGARLMEGDGPKYINTADTPLFHKGTLLYGLSRARQAAGDGQPVIVAEGYMDVIALVRAGFEGAVAPLGTALTETQIQELWKLIPGAEKEPYLCFDGDNAGRRAAWRAVDRTLPHLAPGHSARVVFLPEGEDPDSLIRVQGAKAMRGVLEASIPLAEAVWRMETEGKRTDTPESKAAIKAALEARCDQIADRTVQAFYRTEMRRRVDEAFAWTRPQGPARGPWQPGRPGATRKPQRHLVGEPGLRTGPPPGHKRRSPVRSVQEHLREKVLLATLINHSGLFDDVGESLGMLPFPPGGLDELRQALITILSADSGGDSGLDAAAVESHLSSAGFDTILASVLSESTYDHGRFARPEASDAEARRGWWPTWGHLHHRQVVAELREAEEALAREYSDEAYARLLALQQEVIRAGMGMDDADLDDNAS